MKISAEWWDVCFNAPILHDEDDWGGKYKTYGEMWLGEGYEREENEMKLDERQAEKLLHAMDYIWRVKSEVEEMGKNKRIVNALDKCIGILDDVVRKGE